MRITTLLLDLDGTLIRSHGRAQKAVFIPVFLWEMAKRGLAPWSALRLLRALRIELETKTNPELVNRDRVIDLCVKHVGWTRDEAQKHLNDVVASCFRAMKPLFLTRPEALDFLNWARGRFAIGLATNPMWPEEIVLLRMGWTDVGREHFSWITHSGNMHAAKPNPEYYRELLAVKNLKPEECLMIGNDARKDGPAREWGVPVFLIPRDDRERTRFREMGFASGSFEDLKALLQKGGPWIP